MIGTDFDIPVTCPDGDLLLDLSQFRPGMLPCSHAWVIQLTELDRRHIRFEPPWECFAVEGRVRVLPQADWSGKAFDRQVVARYTLDGKEPTAESPLCGESVKLVQSGTLRVACFRDTEQVSPVFSSPYLVTPFDISPAIDAAPARPDVYLGDIKPLLATTGWRKVTTDCSANGEPLNINGTAFQRGMGVHSRGSWFMRSSQNSNNSWPAWESMGKRSGAAFRSKCGSISCGYIARPFCAGARAPGTSR